MPGVVLRLLPMGLLVPLASFALGAEPVPQEIPPERLFPWASFDPAVPSPQQVTAVVPGARPLRHAELIRYLEALDAASPRATLLEYARSHEGRRLVVLAVGEEATLADLKGFRREHVRAADTRGRAPEQDRERARTAKAVAWMAYAIHGDELSSADAAAAFAYWLVAGEDDRARRIRRELVVLIDPCENPDGRERFLAQTASFAHARPNPDSEDLSHTTVWPWGRGNHYLFDLNRDWFTQVQPESRRSSMIASWLPQLMVDSHEMSPDDTYLFSPPRHPFNPHLPPHEALWAERYAADQARALDERGYAYYTREWNEEFFPGYGSSWASYLGSVGVLYEMSSTEGTVVRQRAGTLRSYAQAIEHQVTSSVANLETLAGSREQALADFLAARRDAVARGAQGPVRAFLLAPGRHPDRADALAALLRVQGIEVLRAAAPLSPGGLRDARTGEAVRRELPAGTWMVPMEQPASRLARVLLDPHVPMETGFLREEREWLERGKGSRIYDTTGWSLLLAWDVEAHWTGSRPAGDWRGDSPREPEGGLNGDPRGAFGYVLDGTPDRAAFAVADLLQRGLAVRVAEKPFKVAGRSYGHGAVLVKREGNPENLAGQLAQVAERWRLPIQAVSTARAEEGPDLGGAHFHPLVAPKVGVFTGMSVSPSSYGAIWHVLDAQAELRFTALDLARFASADLARYNVLVFPPALGSGGGYRASLGKEGVDRLRRWIEAGGTAIAIGSGAEFLADKETGLTKTRLRRQALDRFPPAVVGITAIEAEAAGPFRAAGVQPPPSEKKKEVGAEGGEREGKRLKAPAPNPRRASPYDVAPVLGPGAAPFAQGFDQGTPANGAPVDLATWLAPLLPPGQDKPAKEDLERADERLRRFAPAGVLLRVDLDAEVWLDWGLPLELTAFLGGEQDALVAEPPVQVAARFAGLDRLHLSGLLWPEAAGRLARTAYVTREEVGSGQVILFLDEPLFRGWMLGTRRLFLNAVLWGPGLGTRWSTPW